MSHEATPERSGRAVVGWGWLVLLAALAGLAGWIFNATKPPAEPGGRGREAKPVPVLTGRVTSADVPLVLQAVGTIEPVESVAVRPQISGEITAVGFVEGRPVRRGQLLFQLQDAPLKAELRRAEAQLARDAAQWAQAEADARRYLALAAQGFVPRQQAEQAGAGAAALSATLQADRAQIEAARVQLGYAAIRAPIAGVAGDRALDVGNLVRAGDATPLVTINRLAPILVSFAVPAQELDRVRRYQAAGPLAVVATPRGGQPRRGRLVFLDNAVEPATGTFRLKARFDNADGALVPGQFADVALTLTTERRVLTAPAQAVSPGQSGQVAFVVGPDHTVSQRAVTVARTAGDRVVVTAGLASGETVVTDGTLQLRDGAAVEVRKSLTPPAEKRRRP